MTIQGRYAVGIVCDDTSMPELRYGAEILGQELTWIERRKQIKFKNERNDSLRKSKYTSYQDLPLTLTAPEVGEDLGISRAAAYELVRSKGFPHMRIGTRILVPKDKFLAWIDQQTEVDD
jgi:excisionase family DNA binding protein